MNSVKNANIAQCETPFEKRHQCWFCGEPHSKQFIFPPLKNSSEFDEEAHLVFNCSHARLSVPSCTECYRVALHCQVESIWQVNLQVKQFLIKQYRKDLAIGINWSPELLAESQFEEGNFAGFQQSAWFMYEVAKTRVNFQGWPLVINGIVIEPIHSVDQFMFDGVLYPSIEEAITHYAKVFFLEKVFFKAVFHHLSHRINHKFDENNQQVQQQFSHAVRFCRLLVGSTPDERKRAFAAFIAEQ